MKTAFLSLTCSFLFSPDRKAQIQQEVSYFQKDVKMLESPFLQAQQTRLTLQVMATLNACFFLREG